MSDFLPQICFLFWSDRKQSSEKYCRLVKTTGPIGKVITKPDRNQAKKFWGVH